MLPRQLLACVLASVAAAAAAPLPNTSLSNVCRLIFGSGDQAFDRISLSGTTQCRCESETAASCASLIEYPTVAPNSPEGLLNQYHRPQSSGAALQALLAYQIQLECRSAQARGRRCAMTWPGSGAGSPVCDCASSDGVISFRVPYFIDSVSSRASIRKLEGEDN